MLGRIETRLRLWRRKFSRTHWLARLLHLSVSDGSPNRPGLLLLQIDGLSLNQFNGALDKGELPFLKRLIRREHYQVHTLYSGLPSSTPAVQAELQYGIRTAVPAFSFLNRKKGEIVRMYEPDAALLEEEQILEQLARDGQEPLCKGGSSYANIFKGGVDLDEAHFCASSLGWGSALRAANPFALLFMIVTNINSVIRILVLLALELAISILDFIRGIYRGRNLFKELKFIPTRVAICIMLRELCVIGGKMDIQRGLPVIHINFLGYDEQSHRRGPSSKFAHWTLKGIDDAVARLWNEAATASRRHYEVWIYADHGQSKTTSYGKVQGYEILDAATQVFTGMPRVAMKGTDGHTSSVETQRVRLLGGNKSKRLFSVLDIESGAADQEKVQVAGLGPVAFVYFPTRLGTEALALAARQLVDEHKVPAVVLGRASTQLRVWTADGEYLLPQQTAELFGADHPFIEVLGADLELLCRHPHAGDLTLLGWRKGIEDPITFATENGSHAGLTHEETRAFALLPKDAPLPDTAHAFYRPEDLREAALRYLGRSAPSAPRHKRRSIRPQRVETPELVHLRLMTYNVHSCVGIDGKLAAERIARVIARANPDVVALQELDVGRQRTGGVDQAELIARYLEMDYHFHPHIHLEEEKYGDAILTHLPMRVIKAAELPGSIPGGKLEPRGALWVAVDLHGTEVNIINTHLGLTARERQLQIAALLGSKWGGGIRDAPLILCGDFNTVPGSRGYRLLRSKLLDAQAQLHDHRPVCTFYSRLPSFRIDHIFVNPGIRVEGITVPRSELATVASDHLPLIADLGIPVKNTGRRVDGDEVGKLYTAGSSSFTASARDQVPSA